MKKHLFPLIVACVCLLASVSVEAQQKQYTWTGAWIPTRVSAADGITELDTKIGRFINLPDRQSHLNLISNINKKFPGSAAWATWTVGDLTRAIPSGETLSDAEHESYLTAMDQKGITIFLEIFPFKEDENKG